MRDEPAAVTPPVVARTCAQGQGCLELPLSPQTWTVRRRSPLSAAATGAHTPRSAMSSLKNLVKTRTYRERSQPKARAKLGMLEKHKDYKLRAVDFHRKEDALKKMKEKAALKNPDEFYFNMVRTKQVPPPYRPPRPHAAAARMLMRRRLACCCVACAGERSAPEAG